MTIKSRDFYLHALQIALALFAFVWAVVRACVQSMTGDEAESYLIFAARLQPSHWVPAANNHLLNSLLMRGFTSVFGVSNLTVRAPALIGAALYIAATFYLCQLIVRQWRVRIPLFVCLVYNPFMFDFFVAARGYGLATAFLLCAILLAARHHARSGGASSAILSCAGASALLALSFSASFAFAVVDCVTMLAVLIWAAKRVTPSRPLYLRLIAAAIGPALMVFILLPSWTVLHFPREELWDGATSVREMFATVAAASIYEPNSNLLNPLLYPLVTQLRTYLLPALLILASIHALLLASRRPRNRTPWLDDFAITITGIIALSILGHWILLRYLHVLMPRNRTALFLVHLITIWIGAVASFRPDWRIAAMSRRLLVAALPVAAAFFMICLRLSYFKEWQYQADLKKVYDVVACYNHASGVRAVEVSWFYHAGLNYYRVLSGRENLMPFTMSLRHPPDKQLYVLNLSQEEDFIAAQHLSVVYKGESTDVGVAVIPEIAPESQRSCYVPPR